MPTAEPLPAYDLAASLSAQPHAGLAGYTIAMRTAITTIHQNSRALRFLVKRQRGWVFPDNESVIRVGHHTVQALLERGDVFITDAKVLKLKAHGEWVARSLARAAADMMGGFTVADNEHAIPAELKAALEKQAQARDAKGSYARIFLAVFPTLRQAVADEIACATAPNDVATSIGSIFGQCTTELLALKVNNPSFIIGHTAQAYIEQCTNMMVQAAGMATANAPRELRKKFIMPGGTG